MLFLVLYIHHVHHDKTKKYKKRNQNKKAEKDYVKRKKNAIGFHFIFVREMVGTKKCLLMVERQRILF